MCSTLIHTRLAFGVLERHLDHRLAQPVSYTATYNTIQTPIRITNTNSFSSSVILIHKLRQTSVIGIYLYSIEGITIITTLRHLAAVFSYILCGVDQRESETGATLRSSITVALFSYTQRCVHLRRGLALMYGRWRLADWICVEWSSVRHAARVWYEWRSPARNMSVSPKVFARLVVI